MYFSEEKNQKTFMSCARPSLSGHGLKLYASGDAKVFWFFSSEKNFFLPYRASRIGFSTRLNAKIASAVSALIPAIMPKNVALCMDSQKLPRYPAR